MINCIVVNVIIIDPVLLYQLVSLSTLVSPVRVEGCISMATVKGVSETAVLSA